MAPQTPARRVTRPPAAEDPLDVEVIRSEGRVKTGSARWDDEQGKVVVRVPAGLERGQEQQLVETLVEKVRASLRRKDLNTQFDLAQRCALLNRRFFAGRAQPASVEWVTNQNSRYGSCTPATRVIRISDRVAALPEWVRDYVLVHELAHLIQPNHSPAFWKLVGRYPLAERARGYLMALGLENMEGTSDELLGAAS